MLLAILTKKKLLERFPKKNEKATIILSIVALIKQDIM